MNKDEKNLNKLIPELSDWNNGMGIDVESWIGCVGDFQKAIAYSVVFWPSFIEIDGYIIRQEITKENLSKWIQSCKGDRKSIETMVNHLHIRDVHHLGCPDATPERLAYLGNILREIYECKLHRDFPDRKFCVEFYEGDAENLDGYELTFFQVDAT